MERQELAKSMLNFTHVPKDAGDYEKDLQEILERIPDGWGRWISCDKGWYKLLAETNELLKYMEPHYEVHQVKEKFGALRYYFGTPSREDSTEEETVEALKIYKIMQAIADRAEEQSRHICENCGEYGTTRESNHWLKTLCASCAREQGYPLEHWEARTASSQKNDDT